MKTIRLIAACAAALSVGVIGQARAQDAPAPAQTAQPAQDVGGMPDTSMGQMGSATGKTRSQVYQDLIRSEQSGERDRLLNDLYHGS
jgi:hypothetical protein